MDSYPSKVLNDINADDNNKNSQSYNRFKINSKVIKIKDKDLSVLCRQIGILLESGCEITKIMQIARSQSNKNMSNKLDEVSKYIKQGNSIAESFEKTQSFSTFFISMIKSGEISGNLDIVMHSLADYYNKEYRMKDKIKNASIYPVIVSISAFISFLITMVFVIPNFEMVFINSAIEPPLLTKVLLNVSSFIRYKYVYLIIIILGTIPILFFFSKISPKIKIDNLKFKIPIIKSITQLIVTTRFSKTLGMLVKSGVQIVEAIDISSKVIDSKYIYNKLYISRDYIQKGNTVGYSLELANIFPNLFISMINVGEESGRLDECLQTTEKFYSNELDMKIEKLMKQIEPATIIVLAIFVLIFMVAMVMPMFDSMILI